MPKPAGFFLGQHNDLDGFFGKPLEHSWLLAFVSAGENEYTYT
jgi:hypothetical protein